MSGFKDAFESPLAVLAFYDGAIREGRHMLHPWQARILRDFSLPRPKGEVSKIACVANNGAGKSKYVLAPAVIWSAVNYPGAEVVVTSSSGTQLDKQAARYIKDLASQMNNLHREEFGEDVWEIKYRTLIFKGHGAEETWSYVDLFATDEAGQAEGWHPRVPDGELMIFVDEAKTVTEEIFGALMRCNGCTKRLYISSPGDICGTFYEVVSRPELKWTVHRVTADMCPHISKSEIEDMILKYGLYDPLVRSSVFAEFTSAEGSTVISRQNVIDCRKYYDEKRDVLVNRHAGLDLAAGGDENVMSIWEGHRLVRQEAWLARDTAKTVSHVIGLMRDYSLTGEQVWADDGGLGRGLLDQLAERGYRVNRVLNQSKPHDTTRYANRGTEIWFSLRRLVEERLIRLPEDKTLEEQLTTRAYRRQPSTQKLILEPKAEAKAKGRPSPDRADAMALAWAGVTYPLEVGTKDAASGSLPVLTPQELQLRFRELMRLSDAQRPSRKVETQVWEHRTLLNNEPRYKLHE